MNNAMMNIGTQIQLQDSDFKSDFPEFSHKNFLGIKSVNL